MTREDAKHNALYAETCRNAKAMLEELINEIYNDHEAHIDDLRNAIETYMEQASMYKSLYGKAVAQLKAKDEEIERLKAQSSSVHNLMYRNGYNDAIDCYDTFGNFNTKHKPNAKARKIVAMLGKNWKKSRQFLGKNDEVTVSDQIAFIDAIAILKHKG